MDEESQVFYIEEITDPAEVEDVDKSKNTYKNEWVYRVMAKDSSGEGYGQASLTYVDGKLYVFGGCDRNGKCSGSMRCFDLVNNKWSYVLNHNNNVGGTSYPSERFGHTAVKYNSIIYIFGGQQITSDGLGACVFNDLYVFNTETIEWRRIKSDEWYCAPSKRSSHTMVVYESKLILFGGSNPTEGLLNDLWIYDIESNTWEDISSSNSDPTSWPSARDMHSACLQENRMIISGGRSSNRIVHDDVWTFNFTSKSFEKVCLEIDLQARCSHTTYIIPNFKNSLCLCLVGGWNGTNTIFGYTDVLDLESHNLWSFDIYEDLRRFGHCMSCDDNLESPQLFIYGGVNEQNDYNSITVVSPVKYDTHTQQL